MLNSSRGGSVTRYRTIVADPPWPIGDFPAWHDEDRRSTRERALGFNPMPYSSMTVEEIRDLPVAPLAEPDAHLYLWTVNEYLVEAFAVARRWGFVPSATLVWCKPPMGNGLGGSFASNVEFVLFCRRQGVPGHLRLTSFLADAADRAGISRADVDAHMGTSDMAGWWLSRLEHRARVPTPDQWERLKRFLSASDEMDEDYRAVREAERWQGSKVDTRWWSWPRGKHSAKPDAFLDIVEQVSPGPYVELFARRDRLGWDTWGNESLGTAEMAA